MNKLTSFLIDEQQAHRKGGLYHKTQVQLAYNSNRIEGLLRTIEEPLTDSIIKEFHRILKANYTTKQMHYGITHQHRRPAQR